MLNHRQLFILLIAAAVACFASSGRMLAEDEPPRGRESSPIKPPVDAEGWPLEEVRTRDGHVYRGLIRSQTDAELEFVEVVQPRGKPMYLVVRPIDPQAVVEKQSLPDEERKKLIERVSAFRYRSRIEAGRMENVRLVRRRDDERAFLRYRGPWFLLDSTADDETTRRCVVRIEQIFRAYRQLLPPRRQPSRELRVMLFGSMDEYRAFLHRYELEIRNPAFFSDSANLIVAGSELTRYARRLATTRQQHEKIRQHYDRLNKGMERRLAGLRGELERRGIGENQIDDELNARRVLWRTEIEEMLRLVNAADRRNEARFADVTDQMFRRLYHEGFHAYLENFVYPHETHDVPIWLHEGLAQVFQSGQLEADMLRIDAPLGAALEVLQDDLASDDPLLLDDLLAAGRREFLAGPQADRRAQRLYAYAWGVAYCLTFYEPVLGTGRLDEYVAPRAAQSPPAARFELLIDTPLSDFEARWRQAMLSLKGAT